MISGPHTRASSVGLGSVLAVAAFTALHVGLAYLAIVHHEVPRKLAVYAVAMTFASMIALCAVFAKWAWGHR